MRNDLNDLKKLQDEQYAVKDGTKYEVLRTVKNVRVKVPSEQTPTMFFKEAQELPSGEKVPAYFLHGMKCPKTKVYLNRHFYNVANGSFGSLVTATVEVVKKTTATGREFVMVNIRLTPELKPTTELKFSQNESVGIKVPGTSYKICFRKLEQKQK